MYSRGLSVPGINHKYNYEFVQYNRNCIFSRTVIYASVFKYIYCPRGTKTLQFLILERMFVLSPL